MTEGAEKRPKSFLRVADDETVVEVGVTPEVLRELADEMERFGVTGFKVDAMTVERGTVVSLKDKNMDVEERHLVVSLSAVHDVTFDRRDSAQHGFVGAVARRYREAKKRSKRR